MSNKKLTQEDMDAMKILSNQGFTSTQIAKALKWSVGTVRLSKKHGFDFESYKEYRDAILTKSEAKKKARKENVTVEQEELDTTSDLAELNKKLDKILLALDRLCTVSEAHYKAYYEVVNKYIKN